MALGTGTEVRGALVNGYSAFTNQQNNNVANGVVAVGNVGSERRIINVAGGENDTDATNVKQLKFVSVTWQNPSQVPTYTGYEANGSTYKAPDFNIKNSTYHTVKKLLKRRKRISLVLKAHLPMRTTITQVLQAIMRQQPVYVLLQRGNFATAVGADATAANANSTAIGYKS